MKIIGYAYASSTLAAKLKHGKTGCFYVADISGDTHTDESNFVVAESFSAATEMCKGHEISKWSQRDPEVLAREMSLSVPLENSVYG
jgi:hypothetical protein